MSNHQKLVDDFHKAMFVDHDPAAIAGLYTEDAILKDPTTEEPIRGKEAIGEYHAGFLRAFPDMSADFFNVFGAGEWFAVEFRFTGTHTGSLELAPGQVVPGTGRKITADGCWIGRMAPDGRCAEDHSYFDTGVFASLATPAAG